MDAYPAESGRDADVLLLRAVLLAHSGQFVERRTCVRTPARSRRAERRRTLSARVVSAKDLAIGPAPAITINFAVYLDPEFAMAHLHLGCSASRTDDSLTARREFEQAILLLEREDTSRLLLFGGGFSREASSHCVEQNCSAAEAIRDRPGIVHLGRKPRSSRAFDRTFAEAPLVREAFSPRSAGGHGRRRSLRDSSSGGRRACGRQQNHMASGRSPR